MIDNCGKDAHSVHPFVGVDLIGSLRILVKPKVFSFPAFEGDQHLPVFVADHYTLGSFFDEDFLHTLTIDLDHFATALPDLGFRCFST